MDSQDRDLERTARLQADFDRQADALGLRTEAFASAEACTVGVAFAIASKTVSVATPAAAAAPGSTDDAAIGTLLNGYESLGPQDFASNWRNYATDPHLGIGPSWAGVVDQNAVQYWLGSASLADAVKNYPMSTPRKVTLKNLAIVYIGGTRASATYRVEEQHTNGKLTAGNTAAILIKVDGAGWRIIAATKGGRADVTAGATGPAPEAL